MGVERTPLVLRAGRCLPGDRLQQAGAEHADEMEQLRILLRRGLQQELLDLQVAAVEDVRVHVDRQRRRLAAQPGIVGAEDRLVGAARSGQHRREREQRAAARDVVVHDR
jgi:hypothetical protein